MKAEKAKIRTEANRRIFKNLKKTHLLTLLSLNLCEMSSKSICCSEGVSI